MASGDRATGFTLIEVLIAMAITALVSVVAYTSLSSVISGAESLRESADRSYQINRAWMIISRDLRQFVDRPVRDEFGELEPAMMGGPAARFALSFTRSGWHNPNLYPRSNLQRVNYRLEDEGLWRDSYPVLDRAGNTEPSSVLLLDNVEYFDLLFLPSLEVLTTESGSSVPDKRAWPQNWVTDTSQPDQAVPPPAAVELRLQLGDVGEMSRIYALPIQ